jgi:outer membrane protein assembly factor BamD (BamD/ComL family)
MAESYRRLGMTDLAADTDKVLKENFASLNPQEVELQQKREHWWKFW